jgi:hypothetical protein
VAQGEGPEFKPRKKKKEKIARCQWLTPIILAIWEAEIGSWFELSLGK